ncbi:MAG TPA: DUF3368 domain-containing protein [Terriglobia bacterium]|nr:DUF3368 domain-containing protein [Terriglobia bacterium]
MPIVADTSPLNYLVLIDAVEILPQLFGEVVIPEAVSNELLHPLAPAKVREFVARRPDWLQIVKAPVSSMEGLEHLDAGEVEAILLMTATEARLLAMDDRAGVAAARERGLRVIGTIGVLDAAARRGTIDLKSALEQLGKTTFRMPKRVLEELLSGSRSASGGNP